MRSSLFFLSAISGLAITASGFCLSDGDAETIGYDFGQLISNYTQALADQVLASTFTDQSDSVITLIDSASQPQVPVAVSPA